MTQAEIDMMVASIRFQVAQIIREIQRIEQRL